jgi:cytosine/uracil/thiamine/allantoin permease
MMLRDIIDKVAIPSPRECTTKAERRLATEDLLPVVAAKRQWSGLAFVSFWIADAWNINVLQIAATGMTSRVFPLA